MVAMMRMRSKSRGPAPGVVVPALTALLTLGALAAGCPPDDPGDDHTDDPGPGGEGEGEGPGEGEGEGEGEGLPEACAEPTNKAAASMPGAVYHGTRVHTLMPLDAAQQNAVVAIGDSRFLADGAFCSGTLVADTVVLTAQHCTTGFEASELAVLFGPDDMAPLHVAAVVEKQETDPGTDLAVLRLERAPADDIDVRPIPIAAAPPDRRDIGTLFEQAGYGATHDGSHGRYFVTEVFSELSAQFIDVDGQGLRGVCFGDSGGPSIHVGPAGDVRVFGVLSFGDPECMNVDSFSRVDTQRAFIEAMTGPTPAAQAQPCSAEVTPAGACDVHQALATWCEDGVVARDACAAGEICATDGAGQLRCVPQGSNACGAVTRYGTCDGETLQWCDDGVVRTRDCFACAERCVLLSSTDGYGCVPSDCGELTPEGTCDGSVARWCDQEGQAAAYDCEADGQTCAYLGPVLGYYCYDPVACDGLTYAGTCDGTTLRWCEDGEVIEVDCAEEGALCVDSGDPDTGFVCE